jgi:hypothetical protein
MEHFCCVVVLSCYSLCVVLSVSCYDQFHAPCINLGLMKFENICMYVNTAHHLNLNVRTHISLHQLRILH